MEVNSFATPRCSVIYFIDFMPMRCGKINYMKKIKFCAKFKLYIQFCAYYFVGFDPHWVRKVAFHRIYKLFNQVQTPLRPIWEVDSGLVRDRAALMLI